MALVVGDVHGRLDKVEKFLAYKPEEQHIFTGDYVDSFVQNDHVIYQTLKMLIESSAVLVIGNHDIHYLSHAPFLCSGHRKNMAGSLNKIYEEFLHRFVPVAFYDGFIITHGGITTGLGNIVLRIKEPNIIWSTLYSEWDTWLRTRGKDFANSPIFNIPLSRGGTHHFGGIFWADYRDEEYYEIPQIFGHSKTLDGRIIQVQFKASDNLWALGCDDNKFECFNTTTKEVEEFGDETETAA